MYLPNILSFLSYFGYYVTEAKMNRLEIENAEIAWLVQKAEERFVVYSRNFYLDPKHFVFILQD